MPLHQSAPRGTGRQPGLTHQVDVSAWSAASPEEVFDLLADVTTWTTWAGFKEATYEREGERSRHGVGAVRRLRAGPLSSRETVLEFEPGRQLVYDYAGSLPFDHYRGEVRLTREGGGTRIAWHAEFSPAWPGTGSLLRLFMAEVLGSVATRLARAAEEGQRADRSAM